MRGWLATSLLFAMTLALVGTFQLDASSFWVQLIRSGAEAGIIGGLVDWFAVVAIFRHPLGIPLPHTAVIRKSRDRFAEGIDEFITDNFSDAETASEYIRERKPSSRLSEWLTQTNNAKLAASVVVNSIPPLLTPKRDARIRHWLTKTIIGQLKEQNILPMLGQILEDLHHQGRHQEIVDALTAHAKQYIKDNPELIRKAVSDKSHWYVPIFVDKEIADQVQHSLLCSLDELADRNHSVRRKIDRDLRELIKELKQGRLRAVKVRQLWKTLVTSEQTRCQIEAVWNAVKTELFGGKGVDVEKSEAKIARIFEALGTHLREDTALQEEIDARLSSLAGRISPAVVDAGAEYVKEAVKDWPGTKVASKLEAAVGRELQYIRFNGTILGCMVGLLLFLVVEKVL